MNAPFRGLTLGAVVLALAGCQAPAAPEPEALTISEAGGRYLDAVCPVNAAWDDAELELDLLRLAADRGQADDHGFGRGILGVAEASAHAAERLREASGRWPAGAEEAVSAVAATLEADRVQALELVGLPAADAAEYRWAGVTESDEAARAARAALGLADDTAANCAARAADGAGAAGPDDAGHDDG